MARRGFFQGFGLLLITLLLLGIMTGAAAEPRYPDKMDLPVSDNANIFSQETVDNLTAFQKTLENETGVRLWVVTVHFLDGAEVGDYGQAVFDLWQLGEDDLLLLLSAGDEEAVTVAGNSLKRIFPQDSQQHLLNAYFLSSFQDEQYDEAFRLYIPQLAAFLGKKFGVTVSTAALFGIPAASPTPEPTVQPANNDNGWMQYLPGGSDFLSGLINGSYATEKPANTGMMMERATGFSFGSLILLLILFSLIFGSRRRHMGGRAGCAGCGCGPLGWLAAGLGLGELFKNRRRW